MTLLVNDPCDNFTAAPWTVAGTVAVTASGHTGNGFSFASGSANFASYNLAPGDQTDTMTVGCWLKLGTLNATQDVLDFRSDAGVTNHCALRVGTNGIINVQRIGGAVIGTSSPVGVIAINTWYFVEAQVKLHDTLGTATVRVNGVAVAGGSGDTKNSGTKTVFDQFRLASTGAITTWFVDDVYVRNDATFGVAPTVKAWNGSAFVSAPLKVWSGSAFVDAVAVKTWNGTAFV